VSDGYFFCFSKGEYVRRLKEEGTGCIICGILAGEPGVVDLTVYRDDLAAVSLNLYPYNPGHLLVFPVRHTEDLRGLTREETLRMHDVTRYFFDILDGVYQPSGYNIGFNMGRTAGASIPHLHQHLIPRYATEIGIADLVAGKRVLVEDPRQSLEKLKAAVYARPFSISMT
jgi:ATP adenylyltransferase